MLASERFIAGGHGIADQVVTQSSDQRAFSYGKTMYKIAARPYSVHFVLNGKRELWGRGMRTLEPFVDQHTPKHMIPFLFAQAKAALNNSVA